MKNWIGAGILLLLVFVGIAYWVIPKEDICADKVRGFEQNASSAVEGARQSFEKISATVKSEQIYKTAQIFDKLSPADFSVLKACDTQCALLTRCLRFVFFTPPSQACPREYEDFQTQSKAASELLAKLEETRSAAGRLVQDASQIESLRKGIAEVEKSSGSTGGQVALLKGQLADKEKQVIASAADIAGTLAAISNAGQTK